MEPKRFTYTDVNNIDHTIETPHSNAWTEERWQSEHQANIESAYAIWPPQ